MNVRVEREEGGGMRIGSQANDVSSHLSPFVVLLPRQLVMVTGATCGAKATAGQISLRGCARPAISCPTATCTDIAHCEGAPSLTFAGAHPLDLAAEIADFKVTIPRQSFLQHNRSLCIPKSIARLICVLLTETLQVPQKLALVNHSRLLPRNIVLHPNVQQEHKITVILTSSTLASMYRRPSHSPSAGRSARTVPFCAVWKKQ